MAGRLSCSRCPHLASCFCLLPCFLHLASLCLLPLFLHLSILLTLQHFIVTSARDAVLSL